MPADHDEEEVKRRAASKRRHALGTPNEESFDRITRVAARLFGVPMAAITFLDRGRERCTSRVGFDASDVPHDATFFELAARSRGVTIIPDTEADPRVAGTAHVLGEPHLRFYAGAPLVPDDGTAIGTLAVGDRVPHPDLSPVQSDLLGELAAVTLDLVELRSLTAALAEERQTLREHRRLTELIVEGSAEGIFTVDRDFRCTLWNQAMTELTGLAAATAIGRNVLTMGWPLRSERPAQALRSAVAGTPVGLRDEAYRAPSGEERFFAAHFSPLHDTDGKLVGAIGFVRDTTARHELEDRLRQSQKLEAIGQLTGTVAHDFNNLLTVVLGNVERALPRVQEDPRLRQMLEDIAAAGERGEKLTQQLLAFARRQRLEPKAVDINALVSQMSEMLQRTLPETVELRLDLAARLPKARVDPHQLEVALLNLALNARAAMPKGGTLAIETRARRLTQAQLGTQSAATPGPFVMVAVRDSGTGMTAQVKRRAFEPFFTTKSRGQGTGLGLSQVYGFVMQSLGHIRIESRPGRGTTVELYLPIAPPPPDQPANEAATTEHTMRGQAKILVVEDNAEVREFACSVLHEHGYETIGAGDVAEALRRLRSDPDIALVFSDVVMPGRRNGLDLARELSRTRPGFPIVLTTGYTDSLQDIEREGFPLLLKPYRPGQLVRMLAEVLGTEPPG